LATSKTRCINSTTFAHPSSSKATIGNRFVVRADLSHHLGRYNRLSARPSAHLSGYFTRQPHTTRPTPHITRQPHFRWPIIHSYRPSHHSDHLFRACQPVSSPQDPLLLPPGQQINTNTSLIKNGRFFDIKPRFPNQAHISNRANSNESPTPSTPMPWPDYLDGNPTVTCTPGLPESAAGGELGRLAKPHASTLCLLKHVPVKSTEKRSDQSRVDKNGSRVRVKKIEGAWKKRSRLNR
ncbi:unnamed protein product, partial [Protopolystoma xenopodis]